jgi:hypothetical protein
VPFYTYVCGEGHRTEARGRYEESSTACHCGAPAYRLPFYAPPTVRIPSGRFEADHERFLDRAPYINDAYEKAEQEVGGYVKRPDWFNAGIARTRSIAVDQGDDKGIREVSDLAKKTDANR